MLIPFQDRLAYIDVGGRSIAAVFHPGDSKKIVIFCHGFRSSKIGPNRFFVRLARRLQQHGIASRRFDQHGSGDSEGDFVESSFDDWIATTKALVQRQRDEGYQVALIGQSMGGATVLAVAGDLGGDVVSIVAWVPDPSVNAPSISGDVDEEGGQRVRSRYWHEAHAADIVGRFTRITAPTLVHFATNDEYVSEENVQAIISGRSDHHRIEILSDWTHSGWSYDQATQVIEESTDFLQSHFH